jgi:hypothetical protein
LDAGALWCDAAFIAGSVHALIVAFVYETVEETRSFSCSVEMVTI